jgi:hypothetical protein
MLLLIVAQLCGDEGTGSICGKVVRPDGRPAKRAKISLGVDGPMEDPIGWVLEIKADRRGAFCFQGVPDGPYIVQALYQWDGVAFCGYALRRVEDRQADEAIVELQLCQWLWPVPPMISVDEPMMTTIFDIDQLNHIPSGASRGR